LHCRIVYLLFEAFPIEYQEERGWNTLVGSLPYISILLGVFSGAYINSLNTAFYVRRVKANNGRPVPEARLPPMMIGSVVFPAGCFIFGWTSDPDIHWIGTVIGSFMLGIGFVVIFQSALNYLIDTFQMYAASAVAGNTALRSLFAGVFPLFAPYMFHGLGVPWAASVIGFVGIALMPIPVLFWIYGRRIRRAGKWSRPSTE
jgi:ABC-type spermidine/putrescine transport system permease subunit II